MTYEGQRRAPHTPAYPLVERFATPDGPAPKPSVPPVDPDDRLVPYERGLDLIKNVVVVVTCLVLLYTLWVVYSAVAEFGEQLQRLPL